ncbi:hypothetical protein [Cupriavidus necator]|uniref:Uncharacterized protein n=1 Tax=Cupriavidus pinatubonensis (strain JMP 134 / LMG 1197) TaxID=264198 RepID=Q46ND5_CUPPJ
MSSPKLSSFAFAWRGRANRRFNAADAHPDRVIFDLDPGAEGVQRRAQLAALVAERTERVRFSEAFDAPPAQMSALYPKWA